jgi:16S rRNA (cytosine1402-N4)-methyltransferase
LLAGSELPHITVLLQEAIDALVTDPQGVYVDVTFGRGGHSEALLARLGPKGRLIALDRDPAAAERAARLTDTRFSFLRTPFSQLGQALATVGVDRVDGLLADLGVSSPQIDEASRGFSFMRDGPLDMRMDPTKGWSAAEWLAQVDVSELEEVIRDYGDERHAGPIARAIVSRCEQAAHGQAEPLVRTGQLADLVTQTVRRRRGADAGQHPATRTFQAIRIRINQELDELDTLLEEVPGLIKPGGRLAVISFHSLEDRRVKQALRPLQAQRIERPRGMGRGQWALLSGLTSSTHPSQQARPLMRELRKVKPSEPELRANPRARSAVLRVGERLAVGAEPLTDPASQREDYR